jgi:hypothetical protein
MLADQPFDPTSAPPPDDIVDSWSLPVEIDRQGREQALTELTGRYETTKTSRGRRAKKDPNAWELRGVIFVGDAGLALIQQGGKVRRYRAGDRLPDGRSLLAVDTGGIRVEQSGQVREFLLYKKNTR